MGKHGTKRMRDKMNFATLGHLKRLFAGGVEESEERTGCCRDRVRLVPPRNR